MNLLSDDEIDACLNNPSMHIQARIIYRDFARAIEAAFLAKLASAELLPVQDLSDEEKQFIHCNPDTDDLVELIQGHAAAYGQQAYAQGFAAGAAAQLAEKPSAFLHTWVDGEKLPLLNGQDRRLSDQPITVEPLYTRREA